FISPQSLRYRTKLEGYDNGWVARGNKRTAEFTSLEPGIYTFKVEASIGDRGNYGKAAVLRFAIEPFWWQRHVVQALIVGAILLMAWLAYRARIRIYHRNAARLELLV